MCFVWPPLLYYFEKSYLLPMLSSFRNSFSPTGLINNCSIFWKTMRLFFWKRRGKVRIYPIFFLSESKDFYRFLIRKMHNFTECFNSIQWWKIEFCHSTELAVPSTFFSLICRFLIYYIFSSSQSESEPAFTMKLFFLEDWWWSLSVSGESFLVAAMLQLKNVESFLNVCVY